MAIFAFEHLRSNVVRRPSNCSFSLAVEVKLCGQSEVAELELQLFVDEEVAQFQISMNDSVLVQVLQRVNNLLCVIHDLEFVESFASSEQFVQRLVWTQFKQNVDTLGIFEVMFEADDMFVAERLMNFDFRNKLLFCSLFR